MGGEGLNKPHAAFYALIAYQTAWLKAHYPAAYMAAVLSSDMDHTDKVVHFIDDCKNLGLQIAPPNINRSVYMFKAIDEKNLAYGLGAIKGAGQAAIDAIVENRNQHGEFKDLFDFCQRIDPKKINRRVMDALIKAGAFDTIGPHRASIMASIDRAFQQAEQALRDKTLGQHDLLGATNSKTTAVEYQSMPEWSEHERLFGEKEVLGLYLTGHPIHRYLNELKHFVPERIADLHPAPNKITVIAGVIASIRTIQTKRGDRMAVVTLDDASSQVDVLCFSENYQKYRELLVKDKLIIIEGEVTIDEFSGGHRVLSRDIFSIEQARERYAKYLKIRLSPSNPDEITQLANVLDKYRGGNCRIAIHYAREDAKANLNLGDTWRIRPLDTLLDTLRDLFTENNIEIVY